MDLISIVYPVYLGEKSIQTLIEQVRTTFSRSDADYEIILVDDRSPDNSWQIIQQIALENKKLKAIKLSRNFGQHMAITAGIAQASGDYVVVMDCDLQVSPDNILKFYNTAKEGYEIIYSHTKKRNHSLFKNIGAWFFYKIFGFLCDNKDKNQTHQRNTFSMITKKAATEYLKLNDVIRHYLLSLQWLGFSSTSLEVEHEKSLRGKSSYTIKKLLVHALDGITAHSTKLLRISITCGFIYVSASILLLLYLLATYFIQGFQSGWFSIIFVILFSTGLLLIFMGILGLYLGNIFIQVKNQPLFIVDQRINLKITED